MGGSCPRDPSFIDSHVTRFRAQGMFQSSDLLVERSLPRQTEAHCGDVESVAAASCHAVSKWLRRLPRAPLSSWPNATCLDAAQLMRSENIGSVVIARDGEPLGLVTDRDLAMRVLADAQDPAAVRLNEIMSPHPIFISSGVAWTRR
jgi:hypothetical protein